MQTLHKLQQMLDDTDYMTSNSGRRRSASASSSSLASDGATRTVVDDESEEEEEEDEEDSEPIPPRLWTSVDRAKYRRLQQQRETTNPKNHNAVAATRAKNRPSPPIHQSLSSDDGGEDHDEGRGYALPNLPVYYSDAEESEDETSSAKTSRMPPPVVQQQQQQPQHPLYPNNNGPYYYPPPQQERQQQQQAPPSQQQHSLEHGGPVFPPPESMPPSYSFGAAPLYGYQYPYPPPPPPATYLTPQQHAYYYSQYGPWPQVPPPHSASQQQPSKPAFFNVPRNRAVTTTPPSAYPPKQHSSSTALVQPQPTRVPHAATPTANAVAAGPQPQQQHLGRSYFYDYTPMTIFVPPETMADASMSFDSIQKIGLTLVTVALACYSGVSPRTLPLSQYNLRFYENLGLVGMATIAPIIQCLLVINPTENDMNAFVNTFFTSFTVGFVLAFGAEILATTLVRLLVFTWFEPKIFSLAPKVPIPVIPWVLRETGYRPKRITLLAAEVAASCLVCPMIEEYTKLCILRWTTNLKGNFMWTKRNSNDKRSRSKWVAEPILRPPNEPDHVNANQYVSQMLAASLGLKLCDAGRRILLYTKPWYPNKSFYALCRGIFPIQELCGTMTALGLAKKHLLGVDMPLWKLLFPAVLIHGMANFRGKKPLYRWGSATPWSEMQLPALHILDSSSLPQLLQKGFAKIMWLIIIFRVTGYCVKNYFLVNRQAVKRTTTYAGKPAAFSAELTATEMLKKK